MWNGRRRTDSPWLALLLVALGVIAPTVCVLWFMNEAARSQAEAARQSVAEAYRGQLRFQRDRLDWFWKNRAETLDNCAGKGMAADFERCVRTGLADSFVLRKYPESGVISATDSPISVKARAAQARIRLLVRTDKEAAIQAIGESFYRGATANGLDPDGRLIAADEQLLALHLMGPHDTRRATVLWRLASQLNDYAGTAMPAAQRLFLMDEVRAIAPDTIFPTFNAERLAAEFIEAGDARSTLAGLQPARIEVWQLGSKSGRVTALYRAQTLVKLMQSVLNDGTKAVRFTASPPGMRTLGETIPAGAMSAGWQLSASIADPKLIEQAARSRMASYLWAGYLVVGMMAIIGLFAGGTFRRQIRLARLKTDLVAAVSHELKTPLSSMRLLVDSLLADDRLDQKKTREYLQLMSGENMRLTRLVENFLTFSRIDRNRQRFEFRNVKPEDVIASAASMVRERFQGGECDFRVEAEMNLPAIHADPDALLSALVNLLDNAYKYTGAEKRIRLRAYRGGAQVVFAVEDNGIGIAAREQKRIFRRFYQIDSRLARDTGGCGLGLSIVESIVRAHGGTVRVASRPGAGSTFSVCLPQPRATETAAA